MRPLLFYIYSFKTIFMRPALAIICCLLFDACMHVKVSTVDNWKDSLAKSIKQKEKLTDNVKSDLKDDIKSLVESGFYDKDETLDQISDMYADYQADSTWLKKTIDSDYNSRLMRQATWPAETDFDKLAAAFDQLNARGIIAYHNAGPTREDGEDMCRELADTLKTQGIKVKGYCFYHAQDIDRALSEKTLYIAFGDFKEDDNETIAIGSSVVKTLKALGFSVEWNGTAGARIIIRNFQWQKRFGNTNCSYERAVALLKKSAPYPPQTSKAFTLTN